uniref:Uncharacterized protein n=1 Tax=Romanomermis culicivorax TaxID=13658 RepID=A0A915L7I2_ROMCU
MKRKGKQCDETGAKVASTKIGGAQMATSEMTKCRTGYRQNGVLNSLFLDHLIICKCRFYESS